MTDRHTSKSYPLRVKESIMTELRTIAEEESRTLNKQIEYVLAQYLKERRETETTANR